MSTLKNTDPKIYEAIQNEIKREQDQIILIASENYASRSVLEAQGCLMTNKYAEGYPGKRYYGGCEFVDVAESLAIERAKQLFGAEHVNVQPHSGTHTLSSHGNGVGAKPFTRSDSVKKTCCISNFKKNWRSCRNSLRDFRPIKKTS